MSTTPWSARSRIGLSAGFFLPAAMLLSACGDTTGPTPSPEANVTLGPCTAAGARAIELGQSRNGSLGENDCILMEGPHAQGWRLTLTSRTRLRIELTSADFDAFLLVTDPQMNYVAHDDDGGERLNSRLIRTFEAGSYILWATSFFAEETGRYRLSVDEARTASCEVPVGSVAVGQTVNGILSTTDCLLDDGFFADPWRFTPSEASTVQIDLTSTQFDTFLFVTDASGSWIAFDDDGGEWLNSRLVLSFAEGEYTLWVRSYAPGGTGAYQLSVQPVSAAGAVRATAGAGQAPDGRSGKGPPPEKAANH